MNDFRDGPIRDGHSDRYSFDRHSLDGRKPEIEYPCTWSYRILGTDEPRMRIAVFEIVGGFEHEVTPGLESSQGKYRSLQLELIVRDEAQRLSIFEALKRHPDVRFVL